MKDTIPLKYLVPTAAAFFYVIGLGRIGASLTNVTLPNENRANLPENILLAVIGGSKVTNHLGLGTSPGHKSK